MAWAEPSPVMICLHPVTAEQLPLLHLADSRHPAWPPCAPSADQMLAWSPVRVPRCTVLLMLALASGSGTFADHASQRPDRASKGRSWGASARSVEPLGAQTFAAEKRFVVIWHEGMGLEKGAAPHPAAKLGGRCVHPRFVLLGFGLRFAFVPATGRTQLVPEPSSESPRAATHRESLSRATHTT